MSTAYLLVSHGSRDPRPEIAMQQLAELVRAQRSDLVGTACLELSSQPLHEQMVEFAKGAIDIGCQHIKIIPLFLLAGVHVSKDIPSEVELARGKIGEDMTIHVQPYLGSHPGLIRLLDKRVTIAEARILLAHGSRRSLSLERVEELASGVEAVAAYWAVPPSLESRVLELVGAGYREIAILPYFLFAGGITDAIATRLLELKLQFPEVSFYLGEPLGASAELADLIWDLME